MGRPAIPEDECELIRRLWFAGLSQKELERVTGRGIAGLYSHARRQGWPTLIKVRREIADRIAGQHQNEVAFTKIERARQARRNGIPRTGVMFR